MDNLISSMKHYETKTDSPSIGRLYYAKGWLSVQDKDTTYTADEVLKLINTVLEEDKGHCKTETTNK